jgi:hypothetical protein
VNLLRDDRDADYQARREAYRRFLANKTPKVQPHGLKDIPAMGGHLKPFQAHCVGFALEMGGAGTFVGTGLGKSVMGLEYSLHAIREENLPGLILAPLAVAKQIEAEGARWGYDARVIRSMADVDKRINVCNYDRLHLLDPSAFGPVVFDESSVVKAYMGKVSRQIIGAFEGHRFRNGMSATPSPNDHTELGMQSELVGIMRRSDMLVRWFLNDSANTGTWRLKGHAVNDYFDWLASWSRMGEHPRDLGFDEPGYDLPKLNVIRHRAEESIVPDGMLWAGDVVSATTIHDIKRQTIKARAELAAEVIGREPSEPWLIWVDTNYEADAIRAVLPGIVEVRGSDSIERKEESLLGFATGSVDRLMTKPSIAGHGMNYQRCARQLCVGRSFSYELWHQLIRRSWRFGQTRDVDVHLIVAEGEDAIGRVVDQKGAECAAMNVAMAAAMKRAVGMGSAFMRSTYEPNHEGRLPPWL